MNRKNLTVAVLAGLAGIAGIAGTAQAVNLNPDGLGQVLIYPYYTTNGGNQTLLSVVNTTDAAKAVKVRFLEGYNSREVLDFNLYLSANDVWAAAVADDGGTPTLFVGDDSCTVPYLYGDFGGVQPFLNFAYNDHEPVTSHFAGFTNDGGPKGIERAAEGHIEIIEMGTIVAGSDTEDAITHSIHEVLDEDEEEVIDTFWAPGSCDDLVDNWTRLAGGAPDGKWTFEGFANEDIGRNSGGLFGGAAIVNAENGTMYSYDALAIQGYDKTDGERHQEPGTILPNLNTGDQMVATIFFGVPSNRSVELEYLRPVGAISALFMHENIMNEYTIEEVLAASTEWVVTFPTKSFYVDAVLIGGQPGSTVLRFWTPTAGAPNCAGWMPGDTNPVAEWNPGGDFEGENPNSNPPTGWEACFFVSTTTNNDVAIEPFTEIFDGKACENATLQTWDRDERTFIPDNPSGIQKPVVSPSLPPDCDPDSQICDDPTPFQLCYEVNVMRFGEGVIFGTPVIEGSSLLLSVTNEFESGWGRIDFSTDVHHQDFVGLVGLPAIGFSAFEFENNFLAGENTKAFFGGLFGHKGNVRRTANHCLSDEDEDCVAE